MYSSCPETSRIQQFLDRCSIQALHMSKFCCLTRFFRISEWITLVKTKTCPYMLLRTVADRAVFVESRKVIDFAFTTLRDWLKKLAPLFHPIRSKTKTNRDSLERVFPLFASATYNYFMFWLVHLIICVLCDCLEWLLWFWFYDTQLKTALMENLAKVRIS